MHISRKLMTATSLAVSQILAAGVALADTPQVSPGFYVGGGITQSRFDADTFTVDHKDNSWKIIGGYRMQDNFAVEANYVDFGKATAAPLETGGPLRTKASALSLFAVGLLPMQYIDLFAKVGVARTEVKGTLAGFTVSDNSTKLAYGAGVQFRMDRLAIRAEYEKYNARSISDLDLITLGATYTFGASY